MGRIVGNSSAATGPLLEATRSVPIVFVIVPDPVGAGYVDRLARPGGNATGFTTFEYDIGGKWLKEIAPHMTRAAVLSPNKSQNENITSSPRVFSSYRFFAHLYKK
jgi:ABC-type uncharacterized transport system substrate-binding protein